MKYYFENEDAEQCYNKQYFEELMIKNGIEEIEVFEALLDKWIDYHWCAKYDAICEKGECGKFCKGYSPRNKKSGICVNHRFFRTHGEKVILKL